MPVRIASAFLPRCMIASGSRSADIGISRRGHSGTQVPFAARMCARIAGAWKRSSGYRACPRRRNPARQKEEARRASSDQRAGRSGDCGFAVGRHSRHARSWSAAALQAGVRGADVPAVRGVSLRRASGAQIRHAGEGFCRCGRGEDLAPGKHYWGGISASRATRVHFSSSLLISAANSAGLLPTGWAPSSASFSFMSSLCSALTASA